MYERAFSKLHSACAINMWSITFYWKWCGCVYTCLQTQFIHTVPSSFSIASKSQTVENDFHKRVTTENHSIDADNLIKSEKGFSNKSVCMCVFRCDLWQSCAMCASWDNNCDWRCKQWMVPFITLDYLNMCQKKTHKSFRLNT